MALLTHSLNVAQFLIRDAGDTMNRLTARRSIKRAVPKSFRWPLEYLCDFGRRIHSLVISALKEKPTLIVIDNA